MRPVSRTGLPALAAAVFLTWLAAASALAGGQSRWSHLAQMIGPDDALVVAAPDGARMLAVHEKKPLVPASTLKLLTVLAGFDELGTDYRFSTDFFLDPGKNLKIKGYGDPMLVSEVVAQIAHHLAELLGPHPAVKDIVLDESYFQEPLSIPGVSDSFQPYDAPNGALCVNFNTVFFHRTSDGHYRSAEPQTPLLPVARDRIRGSGLTQGRIVFSRSQSLRYAGQLFSYFLAEADVRVTGKVRPGRVDPKKDRLLYHHISPFDLDSVAGRLMEYSNNFIANQILISIGIHRFGAPGTLKKGVRALSDFAGQDLGLTRFHLAEGSGISRENRITAADMMTVLDRFFPFRHLLVAQGPVHCKTGTLAGVQTRAGYIRADQGIYRFVIMVNTKGRSADPILRELVGVLTAP